MRLALAALLAAASGAALAGDTWILGGAASYHFDRSRGYNERHAGFGLERRLNEDWSAAIFALKNSSNDLSIYALGGYEPLRYGRLRAGVMGGIATGYAGKKAGEKREAEHALRPIPVGGFSASVEWRTFGLNGALIPKKLITVQLKFSLD